MPPLDVLSDAEDAVLAARAADGDVRAFEVLARRFGPMMRVYAAQVLGSTAESDDVVQEAFVMAWRKLPTLSDPGAVRSWLMRIVSRRCIDRIRQRRQDVPWDDDVVIPGRGVDVSEAVELTFQVDAMWGAVAALPVRQRQAWLLRESGGYSYQEIADALKVSVPTVRGLIARARKQLLDALGEWR